MILFLKNIIKKPIDLTNSKFVTFFLLLFLTSNKMNKWLIAIIILGIVFLILLVVAIMLTIKNSTKLPDVSDADVILSLRKVNPNYTGPVVSVTNLDGSISGDIEFDGDVLTSTSISNFLSDNGVDETSDTDTILFVTTWYNQSDNAESDFTNLNNYLPVLYTSDNGLFTDSNGLAQMYFRSDSTSVLVSDYKPGSIDEFSFIIVMDDTLNSSTEKVVGLSSTGGSSIGIQADDFASSDSAGERKIFFNNPSTQTTVGQIAATGQQGAQVIIEGYVESGDQSLYINGSQAGTDDESSTTFTDDDFTEGMTIGFNNTDNTTINNPFSGYIQEIIFYPLSKSDKESKIFKSINNYYNIV